MDPEATKRLALPRSESKNTPVPVAHGQSLSSEPVHERGRLSSGHGVVWTELRVGGCVCSPSSPRRSESLRSGRRPRRHDPHERNNRDKGTERVRWNHRHSLSGQRLRALPIASALRTGRTSEPPSQLRCLRPAPPTLRHRRFRFDPEFSQRRCRPTSQQSTAANLRLRVFGRASQ